MVLEVLNPFNGVIKCGTLHECVVYRCVHVLPFGLWNSDAWLRSNRENSAENGSGGRVRVESVESLWTVPYACKPSSDDL